MRSDPTRRIILDLTVTRRAHYDAVPGIVSLSADRRHQLRCNLAPHGGDTVSLVRAARDVAGWAAAEAERIDCKLALVEEGSDAYDYLVMALERVGLVPVAYRCGEIVVL